MKNRRAISPKYMRGLKGLKKTERECLALRGIREVDQLACLLLTQSELVAKYTASDSKSTSMWSDSSVRRIRVKPDELSGQIKAHSRCFGAVRRSKQDAGQVAMRPNALGQLLGIQRELHAGLPAEVDMTGSIPFIHDQGVNPACVGHAATAAVEMHSGETLSGNYVYLHSKEIDGHPNEAGTTLEAGVEALGRFGVCKLDTWPGAEMERQSLGEIDLPTEVANTEASNFRILPDKSGLISSIEEIKTTLAYGTGGQGRPVLAAVPVYSSWDAAFRTGTVPLRLGEDDSLLGWHAILLVGYTDDPEVPGGGYFQFQNSWGEGWASANPHRAGTGSIPYAYFEENETETHYLEPAVSSSAKVVAGGASGFAAVITVVGLIALCGLIIQPYSIYSTHAEISSDVPTSKTGIQLQIPQFLAESVQTSLPDTITPDTWEALNAEHKMLDHELTEYVRIARQKYPEASLGSAQ